VLDAAMQAVVGVLEGEGELMLPFELGELEVWRRGEAAWVHVQGRGSDAEVELVDGEGVRSWRGRREGCIGCSGASKR
jgi:hypothetical protein